MKFNSKIEHLEAMHKELLTINEIDPTSLESAVEETVDSISFNEKIDKLSLQLAEIQKIMEKKNDNSK